MLETLAELEQELAGFHAWALSGDTLITTLDQAIRFRNQFDAFLLSLVHQVEIQGVAKHQGATNTAAWLRDRYRTPITEANHTIKLATWLHTDGEQTAAAIATGDLNTDQARLIEKAVKNLAAERRAEGETYLVGQAPGLGLKQLKAAGDYLFEVLDPDRAEAREAQRLEKAERRATQDRAFTLTDNGDGRVRVTGWLTPRAAATINAALDPLCKPSSDGIEPRTPTQRRADALLAVCEVALHCGELPDNGGDRPQVVVTLNYDTLLRQLGTATLDDGTRLSATEARLMACDAAIIPTVLDGKGQVLDVGRARRTCTGPLRRALIIRDRGCTFPGCDRPPQWTHAHHLRSWSDGGPTSVGNTALLCGYHHHVIHRGDWEIRINPADGLPEFLPPSYVDKSRTPVRNQYHRRN